MSDFFSMDEIKRNAKWQFRIDNLSNKIDALTAELKTANADRDDLVDRICAVEGEYASLARTSGELSSKLLSDIDALTAQRDRLRAACAGAPAMMDEMLGFLRAETGWMRVSYDEYAAEIAAKAAAIRDALGESEGTGS